MKRLLVLLALSAAFAAEAKTYTETVKTPLGLEIKFVGVHDRLRNLPSHVGKWEESECARYVSVDCFHGNQTIRLEVDNPTSDPQPLTVELPVDVGYSWTKRRYCDLTVVASRLVPPGKGKVVDFTLPHVGRMDLSRNLKNCRFTDGSGKAVTAEYLVIGCVPRNFGMPSELSHIICAVSPSFQFKTNFVVRFEEEQRKSRSYATYSLKVVRPDFTCFHDWRDLACYDALILATNDVKSLSAEFRELAKDYEAVGGKVILADTDAEIEMAQFFDDLLFSAKALAGYGKTISFKSDLEAKAFVETVKHETPFGGIILVLLLFAIVAGPVTIVILAKKGKRIHLLWVFPSIAIVFSLAVAFVIVLVNGVEVKMTRFACEVERPELGRKVVVENRIFVAPFPMREPIHCSSTALVTVDSGADSIAGDCILSTPDGLDFVGHWTPCLWPIRVRTVEVIRTGKEAAK